MKLLLVSIAAAILLAPAAASAADVDLSGAFQSFCVTTGGDSASAVAGAKAQGFVTPPAAMVKSFAVASGGIQDPVLLWKVSEGTVMAVITGHMPFPTDPSLTADVCAAFTIPNLDGPDRLLNAVIGGPPPVFHAPFYITAFTDRGGARKMLDLNDGAALQRAARAGTVEMAMAGNISNPQVDLTMLMLIALRPK